jgi:dTDP-4-amino-4,6-dideoxygalactose transaminase
MLKPWISVWPPLPPSVLCRRPRETLPFPLNDQRCRVFRRARHGLWHAIRAHGFQPGDEVLVPEYHHGSEVETLLAVGLRPRFYRCDDRLAPDSADLERLCSERVRFLFLIHYLGFPQDGVRWRRWANDHRLALVEDAAQAWLSERDGRPAGSLGDIAIFCLYKTLGLSDGGAVVSSHPLEAPLRFPPRGLGSLATGLKRWLRQRWDVREAFGHSRYMPFDPDRDPFELGDPLSAPSRVTGFIVRRAADVDIAARRRANYLKLLDQLRELVATPFSKLPGGASPLQFPIQVEEKSTVLERLASAGVEAADMWPRAHPAAKANQSTQVRELRTKLVGLPVHHLLGESELARIADAARSAVSATRSSR